MLISWEYQRYGCIISTSYGHNRRQPTPLNWFKMLEDSQNSLACNLSVDLFHWGLCPVCSFHTFYSYEYV